MSRRMRYHNNNDRTLAYGRRPTSVARYRFQHVDKPVIGHVITGRGTAVWGDISFREDPTKFLYTNPYDYQCYLRRKEVLPLKIEAIILREELNLKEKEKDQHYLLHLTKDYFTFCDDLDYYVEQVFKYALTSPIFCDMLLKNWFFITARKGDGERLKKKMFTLIKSVHYDLKYRHKPIDLYSLSLSTFQVNFYYFVGMLYFFFRCSENKLKRYETLSWIVEEGIIKIAKSRDLFYDEDFTYIKTMTKLVQFNYKSLSAYYNGNEENILYQIVRKMANGLSVYFPYSQRRDWAYVCLSFVDYGPRPPAYVINPIKKKCLDDWHSVVEEDLCVEILPNVSNDVLHYLCGDDFYLTKAEVITTEVPLL